MERDMGWKEYLSDDERYADIINGIACGGRQIVKKSDLQEMLDFADIPKHLQKMTQDYRMNLIEIRKLEDTSVFKTDVRQVFDFIRCSEDKNALKELMERDAYYQNMEEDAFDVVVQYANATELVGLKDYYRKDGKVDMCKAITEWLADEREAGREVGLQAGRAEGIEEKTRTIVTNMLKRGMTDADIKALAECEQKLIDEVRSGLDRK